MIMGDGKKGESGLFNTTPKSFIGKVQTSAEPEEQGLLRLNTVKSDLFGGADEADFENMLQSVAPVGAPEMKP